MESMKILLTRKMLQKDVEYICEGLNEKIPGEYIFVVPEDFTEKTLVAEAADADVFLGPYITATMLSQAKKLKLIQVPWTGMDTFDFLVVKDTDIPVCNTHSNADAVCEMGVSLTLDLLKKISYHDRKMRTGNWNRDQEPLDLTSRMLSQQTVCILGYGNIGMRLGQIFSAFGAKVIAVDCKKTIHEFASEFYETNDIARAVEKADVVISALPLTVSTQGLVNKELIDKMKNGVMLVNLSRASVMEEKAIYDGLLSKKIGGFASDVWWQTPKRGETQSYPSSFEGFTDFSNVVMSPHRAGFIENALPHLDGAIENIVNLAMGKPLQCVVDIKNQF